MADNNKLVAFRVQRRSIAAAIFLGTHLGYADVKQLPADHQKAEASAISFTNWIVSTFEARSAAIENVESDQEMLRSKLHRAIEQILRSSGAAIYRVEKKEMLTAFTFPELRSRKEVRKVVTTIWPILEAKDESGLGTKLDAAALGLYVQTERLFQN